MLIGHQLLRPVGHRRPISVARAPLRAGHIAELVMAGFPFLHGPVYRCRNRLSVNWDICGARLVEAR